MTSTYQDLLVVRGTGEFATVIEEGNGVHCRQMIIVLLSDITHTAIPLWIAATGIGIRKCRRCLHVHRLTFWDVSHQIDFSDK